MLRKFVAASIAALLLAIAFAPTDSSARSRGGFSRGAHFSGASFRGHSSFRGGPAFRVGHFRAAPYRFAYRTRYASYGGCMVPRRVFTPWGVTVRWVNVCYQPYYGYYGYY